MKIIWGETKAHGASLEAPCPDAFFAGTLVGGLGSNWGFEDGQGDVAAEALGRGLGCGWRAGGGGFGG